MLGILVISHGNLAKELVDAAFHVLGEEAPAVQPVCIEWNLDAAKAKELITKAIRAMKKDNDVVLVLTDLFGGTPTNLAMTFYEAGKVEILTGVNLPLLIKAVMARSEETAMGDLMASLEEKGRKAIVSVSEILNGVAGDDK